MDWLDKMNGAMDYIESNLTGDIDYWEVARRACCSEYHLRRMFPFMTGVSLSEYIRRRRLTLAAFDMNSDDVTVSDVPKSLGTALPMPLPGRLKDGMASHHQKPERMESN